LNDRLLVAEFTLEELVVVVSSAQTVEMLMVLVEVEEVLPIRVVLELPREAAEAAETVSCIF
jgi:hypothetical protein